MFSTSWTPTSRFPFIQTLVLISESLSKERSANLKLSASAFLQLLRSLPGCSLRFQVGLQERNLSPAISGRIVGNC